MVRAVKRGRKQVGSLFDASCQTPHNGERIATFHRMNRPAILQCLHCAGIRDRLLDGIRLPRKPGGRKIARTELEPSQTSGFIQILKQPYSTLVMVFGLSGRRQEEAFAIKPTDLDNDNLLRHS
jgi:hypothetical protein